MDDIDKVLDDPLLFTKIPDSSLVEELMKATKDYELSGFYKSYPSIAGNELDRDLETVKKILANLMIERAKLETEEEELLKIYTKLEDADEEGKSIEDVFALPTSRMILENKQNENDHENDHHENDHENDIITSINDIDESLLIDIASDSEEEEEEEEEV